MTNLTNNKAVLSWIDEMTAITKPDKIVWITGEEDQISELREQAVREGILIKLNPDKLPGCYLHRTDPDDVARVEDRTFICCEKEEDAGPTNHWMEPKEMYKKMYALADGAYKGRTMYIIPYSMSIIGSPFAKYGFELTDSIYVVLNMHIMTRVGKAVCDALGDDTGFIKGLHCQCNLDKDNKYIVHFPQDNTIISMNSNYGGNVLQGKKCFALRIASNLGRQEGWMAEHMLILGIQNPRGEIKYISAAFPSACGKTNLAMLIPPEGLQRWGWRVWCVGDDIAWLRVGKDGRLWAVNPENGFFGVAPGTSMKSNPNALISTHKDTIFTNVALDLSDNTVWWEGLNKTPPARAIDWRGRPWTPQSPEKAAHPNSRFTAPARNCPCLSPEFDNPEGVPISAIIFGGRRVLLPKLMSNIVDVGIAGGDRAYILATGTKMVLMALCSLALGIGAAALSSRAGMGFGANLRLAEYTQVQKFSFSNIEHFSTASLITRLTNDVSSVQMMLMMGMRMLVRAPVMLITAVIMALRISLRLSQVFLVIVPLLIVAVALVIKFVGPIFNSLQRATDDLNLVVQEDLSAIRVVKSFVREDREREKFAARSDNLRATAE